MDSGAAHHGSPSGSRDRRSSTAGGSVSKPSAMKRVSMFRVGKDDDDDDDDDVDAKLGDRPRPPIDADLSPPSSSTRNSLRLRTSPTASSSQSFLGGSPRSHPLNTPTGGKTTHPTEDAPESGRIISRRKSLAGNSGGGGGGGVKFASGSAGEPTGKGSDSRSQKSRAGDSDTPDEWDRSAAAPFVPNSRTPSGSMKPSTNPAGRSMQAFVASGGLPQDWTEEWMHGQSQPASSTRSGSGPGKVSATGSSSVTNNRSSVSAGVRRMGRELDAADPDANFFKMDTWNADDSDLDDEVGTTNSRFVNGSGSQTPVPAAGQPGWAKPALRSYASSQASSTPAIPSKLSGGRNLIHPLAGSDAASSGAGGSLTGSGYVGSKGVGQRKDVILEGSGLSATSLVSEDSTERMEWQSMLASVLGGEILKGEKSRIGGERPTSETFKREQGLSLWWQIRAKMRGRSEEEERRRVEERRERTVDAILEEVERFTVVLPEQFRGPGSVKSLRKSLRPSPLLRSTTTTVETPPGAPGGGGKESSPGDVPDPHSGADIEAVEEELGAEDFALEQLLGMLNKLSLAESLYPHLSAMKAEKPLYASEAFQAKVEAMLAWVTMVTRFRVLLERLQRWTGSKDLDMTKRNTNAERALVGGNRYRPIDPNRHGHSADVTDNAADDSTFIERLLKEDSITRTFNRRALTDLYRLIYAAKQTIISYAHLFNTVLGLQNFELGVQNDLALLVNFPTRLLAEAMRVRLAAARRLQDPSEAVIADMTEAFRRTMLLAVAAKAQYGQIMEQDPDKKWQLPPCIADGFDHTVLDGLKAFFKLLHWTLKSGSKAIYFRETEVLENEWEFLYTVAESVEGGDVVVAEHFCSLTNKLMVRVIEYFDTQLRVPMRKDYAGVKVLNPTAMERTTPRGEKEEFFSNTLHQNSKVRVQREMSTEDMISWFSKVLDAVKMRYRKLQRFARRLTQRFDNSAEYNIEEVDLDLIIESLDDTGHFMVYTQTFEQEGTYIIADASLRERPDLIKQLLYKSFSSLPRGRRHHSRAAREEGQLLVDGEPDVDGPGSSGVDGSDAENDVLDGSYLLVFSPRRHFFWPGPVMSLDLPLISLKMQDCRIRLIADGPVNRLHLCKETFLSSFTDPDSGEPFLELDCITEQQAHLPRIQRELKRIAKSTNRLSESIVESVAIVRTALRGGPGTQDLLENWFTFATDHGQRVGVHMDHAAWSRFSRQLMRLSISWIAFITDSCDPTDRKTFRWAVNALEYAMLMTRGNNILHLDQSEFALLRSKVASCMALLISHFDILGARSSIEAKKEAERLEAMRRLQRLQENMDDEYGVQTQPDPLASGNVSQREKVKNLMGAVYGSVLGDHSIRLVRDQRMLLLDQIDQARVGFINDQHMLGQVLDEEVSEDRSLLFLAASSSNIAIKWQQGGFIGGGANGNVYIGFNLDSGGIMAVKEIRVQDLSNTPALYKQIKDESDVMQMLSHPNVVEYYGIEVHRDRVYIFEEYCEGGSLADLLEHGRIEDEEVVLMYTLQMLRGLEYLHSKGVEHRDVKPDNILLGVNSVIKFVDFGAAKVIAKGNRTLAMAKSRAWATGGAGGGRGGMMQAGGRDGVPAMNSLAGTPMYMAPEVIKNEKTGRLGAMDIWSLGCVILEFATGRKPWSNLDNEWAIMFHIGIATKHPPLPEPGQLSEIGIDFIESCLTLEPAQRPTAPELLEHPWLKDFITQMALGEGPNSGGQAMSGNGHHPSGGNRGGANSLSLAGTASLGSATTLVNSNPSQSVARRTSSDKASSGAQSLPSAPTDGIEATMSDPVPSIEDALEDGSSALAPTDLGEASLEGDGGEAGEEYVPFIDPDTGLEMYTDETGRRYWLFDGEWHAEGEDEDALAGAMIGTGTVDAGQSGDGEAACLVKEHVSLMAEVTQRDFASDEEIEKAKSGVRFG